MRLDELRHRPRMFAVRFITVVWLATALLPPGCRVFRRHKISDESIAAARQLSLQGIDAQQKGQGEQAEMLFAAAILRCPTDERARSCYAESLWRTRGLRRSHQSYGGGRSPVGR